MMRTLKKWGGFLAVAAACIMLAPYAWANNADTYISRGNAKGDQGQYQEAVADL